MSDFIENRLKSISMHKIEEVIGKAVSAAVGEEFESKILKVDYGPGVWPQASFEIMLCRPDNHDWMNGEGKEQ